MVDVTIRCVAGPVVVGHEMLHPGQIRIVPGGVAARLLEERPGVVEVVRTTEPLPGPPLKGEDERPAGARGKRR